MPKFFPNIFGKEFVHTFVESIYSIIKINFFFNLTLLPWIILNLFLKFTSETMVLYLLVGLLLYPAIKTFFSVDAKFVTFKEYFRTWKQNLFSSLIFGVVCNLLIGLLLGELLIVLSQKQLYFLTPVFMFALMFATVLVLHMLRMKPVGLWKQNSKTAVFLSVRYVFQTLLIFGLFVMFLGIYYIFPYLNLVLTGSVLLTAINFLIEKVWTKMIAIKET